MRMTKVEAVASFRESWSDFYKAIQIGEETALQKDVHLMIMLICLNKDGYVTDYQAYNWSNPF